MRQEQTNFKQQGERENHLLQIRLSKSQKERLEMLSQASGYKSVSEYVRFQCLNPSMELKINQILSLLQDNKEVTK